MNEKTKITEAGAWQISPGEWYANLWPQFRKDEIIAIGWKFKQGSLLKYDKDTLAKEIRSVYNEGRNTINSCWDFSRNVKNGAIIVAKKGSSKEVYGIGVVDEEYHFASEREGDYKHVVGVKWPVAFDDRVEVNVKTRFVQWAVGQLDEEAYNQIKESILKQFPKMKGKFDELEELSKKLQGSKSRSQGGMDLLKQNTNIWKDEYDLLHAEGRIELVTFHPSYSYEEFVEGYKPVPGGAFKLEDGIFKKMCTRALAALLGKYDPRNLPGKNELKDFVRQWIQNKDQLQSKFRNLSETEQRQNSFVLIIDEINRANISKVLGELIFALEYRGEPVKLTYSQENLIVPPNLYIIGTMNTADTSIALLDVALRRRFGFQEFMPNLDKMFEILRDATGLSKEEIDQRLGLDLRTLVVTLNHRIDVLADREKQIGHTVFLNIFRDKGKFVTDGEIWKSNLKRIWFREVIPLLQQYFYNDYRKMMMVLGEGFVEERQLKTEDFCKTKRGEVDDVVDTEEPRYELKMNEESSTEDFVKSLTGIYGASDKTVKEEA